MAAKIYQFAMLLVLSVILCRGAVAQSGCSTSTMASLSTCISYVTGNVSTPTPACCTSLYNVVQSQPQCICPLLSASGAGGSIGVAINQTLATALPAVCSVPTPVNLCNAAANGPAPSIAPAPAQLESPTDGSTDPAETPSISSIPAGGSRTGSNGVNTSDGTSKKSSAHFPVVALFAVIWIANTLHF